jgi:hypothetical protein
MIHLNVALKFVIVFISSLNANSSQTVVNKLRRFMMIDRVPMFYVHLDVYMFWSDSPKCVFWILSVCFVCVLV